MNTLQVRSAYCDVGMVRLLRNQAKIDGLISDQDDFVAFVAYLRKVNAIDDLFYQNLILSEELDIAFSNKATKNGPLFPPFNRHNDETKEYDLKKLYAEFNEFPDEVTNCSIETYFRITLSLTWKTEHERDRLLNKLDYMALEQGIITRETFNKLEVIREKKALDWTIHLKSYLDVVQNAKDKLSPTGRPEVDPSLFSTKYAERKEKITRRGRLYRNFDSTQVMMLAEIIQKTAKRMDAKRVAIDFQYTELEDSETETYVLSPMERYRLSIKLLRKDMGEVMRSDLFRNTTVEYEDLISAAFETGLIKSEELELILKFEDFWNPKNPKWKTYTGFAFSLLGTATFYLPPPWSVVGAIALVATQSQILKSKKQANSDDNWNVVI